MASPNSCPAPVIGILSHPGDGASGRLRKSDDASNIPASYVKLVESAGARVIPLIYNEPEELRLQKLTLVNGVLFIGGHKMDDLYYSIVEEVFNKALERNDAGDHFPVYAIDFGFELLSMIVSKKRDILEDFSGRKQASTLQFNKNTNIGGTVFEKFPPGLLQKLKADRLVWQNHSRGLSPKRLLENPSLSSFFKIVTTSTDENNKVYVSTVQAHQYPVTGFQWHPEKNAFEWGLSRVPHTEDAIRVTQNVANYLVREARKSTNRPPARLVRLYLIYNYSPIYGGRDGKGYDQVYIFP